MKISEMLNTATYEIKEFFKNENVQLVLKVTAIALAALAVLTGVVTLTVSFPGVVLPILGAVALVVIIGVIRNRARPRFVLSHN